MRERPVWIILAGLLGGLAFGWIVGGRAENVVDPPRIIRRSG